MVTVPTLFHTACKAQSPKTRIRIYLIDSGVDCTDDTDVQTNGVLLKRNSTDTDSNGRVNITAAPVTFTEYYNPNTNIEIGRCPSNTVSMVWMNDDGAISAIPFDVYTRCKIFIDLWMNNAWQPVPMGVYMIEKPKRLKASNVSLTLYDQMKKLDAPAGDWFNNWLIYGQTGLTFSDYVDSMCYLLGIPYFDLSLQELANEGYAFMEPPFDASEMTYRDILEYLCEANGACARFDRNGRLVFSTCFDFTTGTRNYGYSDEDGVFDYSEAEYTAQAVTGVTINSSVDDVGVVSGSGNMYLISENAFLNALPDNLTAQDFADAILRNFGYSSSYIPTSLRAVGDWSLEAGDVISVTFAGTTRLIPVMQQQLTWIGGSVIATISATGDETMPKMASKSIRRTIQQNREMYTLKVTKVGSDEVIASINLSPEQITIDASKISLLGYVTVNNGFWIDQNGKMGATGAEINGNLESTNGNDSVSISGARITVKKGNANTVAIAPFTSEGIAEGLLWLYHGGVPMLKLEGDGHIYSLDSNGKVRSRMQDKGFFVIAADGSTHLVDLYSDGNYTRGILRNANGNGNIMIDLICDTTNGQIELNSAGGVQRNFLGAGRVGCYDTNGTEKARLTYENNGTLNLGGVTMTSAQLSRLLQLI
ncbi:MAG: hypothetical protein IKZ44_06860 [Clostridia bacterium]|nr:hypothetical protein [Clostridia bacterium]